MLTPLFPATTPLPAETEVTGAGTIEQRTGRDEVPALWDHGIATVARSSAAQEFRFVRSSPAFAQVLVTLSGQGCVWSENRWLSTGPGTAYITPPGKFHAYHTAPSQPRWEVGWMVVPQHSPVPFPHLPAEPSLVGCDSVAFGAALVGLIHEARDRRDPALLDAWIRLVRGLASRAAGLAPRDELIDLLWRKVGTRLSHPWTLAEMAGALGCSEEHLRRLCQRRHGCSPMRHLVALRMQRASGLLAETHLTIAAIGQAVGYENEFAFSNAFKRWSRGTPPSLYRLRTHSAA